MLKYNPSYAKNVGTNEFYFPDTTSHADEIKYSRRNVQHVRNDGDNAYEVRQMPEGDNVNYNKGFAARKALLGLSAEVNCEIPLNRYSFFEALKEISAYHDICYDMVKNKGECDKEMVKSLDKIPYGEMPKWGSTARFLINTKQKLGLGVNSKNAPLSNNWS